MERVQLHAVNFIPTGSTLLDLAIGGGWAGGRIFNLVGDKSSGKTLLAIECFANFSRLFATKGRMRYGEAEAAFDDAYAETLGFPKNVERPEKPLETVEEFFKDLSDFCAKPGPSIYILDSLDALSDEAEKGRDMNEGSYGVEKAKKLSQLFRRLVQTLSANSCTLGVISQIRENIGVTFGETKSRSGGKALDFYCSQIVWLAEIGKLKRTVREQELVVGVDVRARCKKCKVGIPFREAYFSVTFGYGVDNELSILNWLLSIKAFTKEEFTSGKKLVEKCRKENDLTTLIAFQNQLIQRAKVEWSMLEEALAPKIRKYN